MKAQKSKDSTLEKKMNEYEKTKSDLENEIISLSKQGHQKDNIRDNTFKTHGQHYNNKKSFNVVFGRKWNSLLEQGFLASGQQDNN